MVTRVPQSKFFSYSWSLVYVDFLGHDKNSPIRHDLLHRFDWCMGGELTRFAIGTRSSCVFIPTMQRLPFGLLCLDREMGTLDGIIDQCRKNRWEKISAISERDPSTLEKKAGEVKGVEVVIVTE